MTDSLQVFERVYDPRAAAPSPTETGTLEAETSETDSRPCLSRLFYLDHLRVLLTVLVVLHHVAVTYGNIPIWYYTEPARDATGAVLGLFNLFNQAFFMGFFFLIAGYFVPGSYDRKGGRAFLRDRLGRLGIPLLVFLVVLGPVLAAGLYPKIHAIVASRGAELPYWRFYIRTWGPGPLWFVEILLIFSWIYVLFRKNRGERSADQSPEPALADGRAPAMGEVLAFALLLAVATYLWRFIVPIGQFWPLIGLPTPAYLPQYASLFIIGIRSYRRRWLQALPRSSAVFGLAQAVIATAALYPVTLGTAFAGDAWLGHGTWQSMAYALWESLFAVGVILTLLVLFREWFNGDGRIGRFLSRQSYAVYIIHPLVLVALGHAFASLSAIAVVKFLVVAAIAIPLCWASAYLVRSLPLARRVL
jgi:peptidoglycan/LPS O-acetylase OafA/YrhL